MSGGQFEVVADALRAHARSVETVADRIETARAAGASVRLGRGAYGTLPVCQLIAALLDPVQQGGVDALAAAVDALHGAAGAVRAAAIHYDTADAAARARLAP